VVSGHVIKTMSVAVLLGKASPGKTRLVTGWPASQARASALDELVGGGGGRSERLVTLSVVDMQATRRLALISYDCSSM